MVRWKMTHLTSSDSVECRFSIKLPSGHVHKVFVEHKGISCPMPVGSHNVFPNLKSLESKIKYFLCQTFYMRL